jgi:acyl-coenzyme A thioesterase PaaI-like protein
MQQDAEIVERNVRRAGNPKGGLTYTRGLGLEFVEGGYGYIKFKLPYHETTTGPDGCIATGALLTLVDHTGALSAWMTSEMGNPRYFGSTVKTQLDRFELDIREDVFGEGRALAKHGELINSEVKIVTAGGRIVGLGSTIYRIIDRGEQPARS